MAKIKTISKAVPSLVTWLIAETCLEKAGITPTKEVVNWLVTFANYQFNKSDIFRRGVMGKGNSGRDYLYMFMEHWIKGRMWERNKLSDEMNNLQEPLPDYKS